ncbi:MAG TPA: hypothetical protein VFO58_21180 [Vicinamibacterales bacterium]|nr:hypothetical protein [Vicinamibacterales bacterium]
MRFDDPTGRRADVALELLREGKYVVYRGLGLHFLGPQLECRLFVTHPEVVDEARAESEFSLGRAKLDELLNREDWTSALAGRLQRWELLLDYYGEAILLCRLNEAGKLLWSPGWPKRAV